MNEVPFLEEAVPLFDTHKQRGQKTAKDVVIKINSFSFGDTLAATPTIRKLAECYAKKIIVCTSKPFLFEYLISDSVSRLRLEKLDVIPCFANSPSVG